MCGEDKSYLRLKWMESFSNKYTGNKQATHWEREDNKPFSQHFIVQRNTEQAKNGRNILQISKQATC